ncbi:transmembrane protein 116 [Cynoglossus semilaevis]|uniref:transmembrane protein 116 n=1 Tax=Cynoglossus semilaevis TaxID=244447 RepID=UPI0004981645|nr:transmembrane protein 116 [Cynoglossus semilaevis]
MWTLLPLQDVLGNSSKKNMTETLDWNKVKEGVRYLQLLLALLSVVGSGLIISFVMSQRLGRKPEMQPLLLLCVSDFLLAFCWLLGAAIFFENRGSMSTHCYNMRTLEQAFYMAAFFFTLNYTWSLYSGITEKLKSCFYGYSVQFSNRVSTAGRTTAVLSGMTPLLLVSPVLIYGNIRHCQANFTQPNRCLLMETGALFLTSEQQQPIRSCRLLHIYAISTFCITFVLTVGGVTVLAVKAWRLQRRLVTSAGYMGTEQRAWLRVIGWRMLLYPLIFVFCWGPVAALTFLDVLNPTLNQGKVGVALYMFQTLTSVSHGFLNSLVYCWTHLCLRHTSRAALCRDMDTQTPLLSSQKNQPQKRSYRALS